MKRVLLCSAILLLSSSYFCECLCDEIDVLLKQVAPPARFSGYTANFRIEERSFVFNHASGPKTEGFWIILDGDLNVGYIRKSDNTIRIIDFYPEALKKTLEMPTGRYHMDTELGTQLETGLGISGATSQFSEGGSTLTFTRKSATRTNTFVFSFDPVTGYVVTGTYQMNPAAGLYSVSAYWSPGTYDPWPDRARYKRTAYTPSGRTGYVGYFNNSAAIDKGDHGPFSLQTRDGGFIAGLDDSNGWGVIRTREGGGISENIATCNAHNIWFEKCNFGANTTMVHRLMGAPPELTQYLCSTMTVWFETQSTAIILLNGDDFEQQPCKLNTAQRGLYNTSGMTISTSEGFSGSKSLSFKNYLWPNLPQVPLVPLAKFRLEAMMKVTGTDTVKGFITGKTYEWSPHGSPTWYHQLKTAEVVPGDGWKKVSFEIDVPQWDPFIDFRFYAQGGTAYIDDFSFKMVSGPAASVQHRTPLKPISTQEQNDGSGRFLIIPYTVPNSGINLSGQVLKNLTRSHQGAHFVPALFR